MSWYVIFYAKIQTAEKLESRILFKRYTYLSSFTNNQKKFLYKI